MKVRITHLKAPWPAGSGVGDVLELAEVPAWAVGKCEQVADDAPAIDTLEKLWEQVGRDAVVQPVTTEPVKAKRK